MKDVRLRQSSLSSLHTRSSPAPRRQSPVTGIVTASRSPATPSPAPVPPPAPQYVMETRTSEPPSQSQAAAGGKELEGGGGATASQDARERKRGRGVRRRESPALHSRHPFPTTGQVLVARCALASGGALSGSSP